VEETAVQFTAEVINRFTTLKAAQDEVISKDLLAKLYRKHLAEVKEV